MLFDGIDEPGRLDGIAVNLSWAATGLAVVALVVGLLGLLSAPLYLLGVVLLAVAGLAVRRRHAVQAPLERMQYRDGLITLTLGTMILFAVVASVEALGIVARLDVIDFTVDAGPVMVLAHVVLTAGVALIAGATRLSLGVEHLYERTDPPWLLGLLFGLSVAFFAYSLPVGLGLFEGTALSRTHFEWIFYAGAGLLGAQLLAFFEVGLPGPFEVAERINDRLDLQTQKRFTVSIVAALAIVYAVMWFVIHMTLSPALSVALPGIDPTMLLIPVILVPEVALAFLTIREVRRAEGKPFYDRTMKWAILGLSGGVAGIMGLLFFVTGQVDFIVFLILAMTGPFGFYEFARIRRLRKMEEKLPDLLRDLAEYWKGGLSMTDAIDTLAKGEYGELTPEVRKMSVQLSWGLPFHRVLELFAQRVNTQLINRAVSLIQEANRAGGKIADILMAAANDAREIKWLDKERQSNMSIYVAIIYMAFGVFLAVVAIIASQFLPAIVAATQSLGGTTQIGSVQIRELDRDFVVLLFFAASLVQSIGSGMVGGVMGEGEFSSGLKHVFIMVLISYVAFRLVVGL